VEQPRLLSYMVITVALIMAAGCAATHGTSTPGSVGANASWEVVAGPPGSTRLRMVDISSNGTIFVAERSLGFFRSTDSGATWTAINNGLSNTNGWSVSVEPGTQTLIASTFATGGGNVVWYRSIDNGDHWTVISGNYSFDSAGTFTGATFVPNGNIVFGGHWSPSPQDAVWYSTDDGVSAQQSTTNPVTTSVFGIGYNPVGHDLWLGTEAAGVYRSTDNGVTFNQTYDSSGIFGDIRGFAFNSQGLILITTGKGVYRSTSAAGTAWTQVLGGNGRTLFTDSQSVIYYAKKADTDPVTIYRSSDGGSNWQPFDAGIPAGLDIESLAQNPNDGKIYAASNGPNLYRTVN
jgi:hypothetical protein